MRSDLYPEDGSTKLNILAGDTFCILIVHAQREDESQIMLKVEIVLGTQALIILNQSDFPCVQHPKNRVDMCESRGSSWLRITVMLGPDETCPSA